MSIDMELIPKNKRAARERWCEAGVYPHRPRGHAPPPAGVAKAECCESHEDGCGCSAGEPEVRATVRERYAAAALASGAGQGCGCGPDIALADQTGAQVFGDALYAGADTEGATDAAISASLG